MTEVFALVGPAGTGKSHRANLIAHEHGIGAIIDDGLLIQGSRIVAGTSAKREETRIGAVRVAIFQDPDHRDEVRRALDELQPRRLLVLGTSDEMVHRICDRLDLPRPDHVVRIEDIATPDEIRQARRTRRLQGKHVIPAPTVEVKRRFSGRLIDPLRYFARGRSGESLVVDKSTVQPTFSSLGKFLIEQHVLEAIAAHAATEVDGVREVLRSRLVTHRDGVRLDGVKVELDVALALGRPMQPILRRVQQRVNRVLEYMTALHVLGVDVTARKVVLDIPGPAGSRRPERAAAESPGTRR